MRMLHHHLYGKYYECTVTVIVNVSHNYRRNYRLEELQFIWFVASITAVVYVSKILVSLMTVMMIR